MKTSEPKTTLRRRAEEALRSLLSAVSTVKLKEISHQLPKDRTRIRFVAHVDVFGHSRELACEVRSSRVPADLRKALDELRRTAEQFSANASPVLIAPSLSAEAQAICKELCAGFLDFDGNARIAVGEVFIGKRTLTRRASANNFDRPSITTIGPLDMPVVPAADHMLGSLPRGMEHSRPARHSGGAVAVA